MDAIELVHMSTAVGAGQSAKTILGAEEDSCQDMHHAGCRAVKTATIVPPPAMLA